MRNKLSIIIPCYNCEETIEEAVNSIYLQNIDISFEIIMVDDKSVDNTPSILKKLADKYTEIKVLYHNKNKGGGATRNSAVESSEGNIIFCLDSDDILPPNTLPKMYRFLLDKKCDGVVIHKSIKFNNREIHNIDRIDISPFINTEIPLDSLISKEITYQPICVNFMYTKDAFIKAGGYPTNHGYDTQGFGWRFMCAGLKAYTCLESEYLHRINFKESYYLREYNNGKINYNWRDIFIENYFVFNEDALNLILSFNYQDFTKSIVNELYTLKSVFKENVTELLGNPHPKLNLKTHTSENVKRNSLKGYIYRIKNRIKKMLFH